jgi:hypothetical protein
VLDSRGVQHHRPWKDKPGTDTAHPLSCTDQVVDSLVDGQVKLRQHRLSWEVNIQAPVIAPIVVATLTHKADPGAMIGS